LRKIFGFVFDRQSDIHYLTVPSKSSSLVKTGIQVFWKYLEVLDPGSRLSPGKVSFNRDDGSLDVRYSLPYLGHWTFYILHWTFLQPRVSTVT
jgi:hypothetical protein